MRYKNCLWFIASALFMLQCSANRQHAENAQSAAQHIRQNTEAFSNALVAGNFEAVVQAYTPDAKIFPPGLDILQKHEAIRNYWTPAPGQKNRVVHHKVFQEEIKITGDHAYDWGYYEGRTRLEDGSEQTWRGKYVIVWKQTAPGVWKIYLDAWNRIN